MKPRVAADGRLHGVPGWEGAHCVPLRGGLTNRTWQLEFEGQRGVLKIDKAPRSTPLNERPAEAEIQRAAAARHIAPQVLFVAEHVLLTEFRDGEVWSRGSFDVAENLQQLAETLRKLHALPLTGRLFDAHVAAQSYLAGLNDRAQRDNRLMSICSAIIMNRRRPQNICCCHNDLVAANMISSPHLMFLDWEYACDNDPLFDLATVAEHHELNDRQVGCLLDAYFDGNGDRWKRHLASQQRLYLALLWLWMASRTSVDDNALAVVGERVLTSCS